MNDDSRVLGEQEAYESLANGVVIQAAKDYRRLSRRLKKNPRNKDALREKEILLRFFKSDYFSLLTSVNPKVLVEKIDKEV